MLSLRMLAGRHLPVRSMTLCFVGRRPRRMLFWKAAENKLLRELVGSKQAVVEKTAENKLLRELVESKQAVVEKTEALVKKMEEQQDSTARELLHTVARHRAVIVHRVLLDSCLRAGCERVKFPSVTFFSLWAFFLLFFSASIIYARCYMHHHGCLY